jgi:DNA invertase Pin-like site-specific DNA recombinase
MDQRNQVSTSTVTRGRNVAIYVLVSTAVRGKKGDFANFMQNSEVQEQPLRDLITQRGWTLHRVYSDHASVAKERRPGLDALMADARRGLFDVVAVWRFDRLARSVKQLINSLDEFRTLGLDFVSHQEALDTSTPMGHAALTIVAAIAELGRSIIRERVIAGLKHAGRNGTRSGKLIGRPRVVLDQVQIRHLRDTKKLPWPKIARTMHSSVGSVRRAYKASTDELHACQSPE